MKKHRVHDKEINRIQRTKECKNIFPHKKNLYLKAHQISGSRIFVNIQYGNYLIKFEFALKKKSICSFLGSIQSTNRSGSQLSVTLLVPDMQVVHKYPCRQSTCIQNEMSLESIWPVSYEDWFCCCIWEILSNQVLQDFLCLL